MGESAVGGPGPPAFLVMRRRTTGVGTARQVVVRLDGGVAARLSEGDAVHRGALVPGAHEVRATLDWMKSAPLVIDPRPGDTVVVDVWVPWSSLWKGFVVPGRALGCTVECSPGPSP